MKCDIHLDREANSLCLTCQRWYCSECMSPSALVPQCQRCSRRAPGNGPRTQVALIEITKFLTGSSIPKVALVLATVISLVSGFLLQEAFKTLLVFAPFVGITLADFVYIFLVIQSRRPPKAVAITWPQFETCLRLNKGRITALELSMKTGTSERQATDYLNKLVIESVLSVSTDATQLVYSRPEISK